MTYLSEYYSIAQRDATQEIAGKSESYILGVSIEEYLDYLSDKFSLPLIEFSQVEKPKIEKDRRYRTIDDCGRETTQEFLRAVIYVPVQRDERIKTVLGLRPGSFSLTPHRLRYEDGFIITETSPDPGNVSMAINSLREEVRDRNADVERHNTELLSALFSLVQARKSKIEGEEKLFEELIDQTSIPLERKNLMNAAVLPSVSIKKAIKPIYEPTPKKAKELRLATEQFGAILELIDNSCRQFERTPGSFCTMGEEQLRDIILTNLNSVFQGEAVGEAFSKSGKTDIYLRVPQGGIFIAECKYWKGPKTVHESADQILSYLTWRNSYGVVILFSSNVGFSEVIDSAGLQIKQHASVAGGFQDLSNAHFVTKNGLPEDPKLFVEMHYLIYNLHHK